MTSQPDTPGAPVPPEPPELWTVERIRDELFYGFRNYHTPIREQQALVDSLIDAARLEGRGSRADGARRDAMRGLFDRLRASARNAEAYDDDAWTRFAGLLGIDEANQ